MLAYRKSDLDSPSAHYAPNVFVRIGLFIFGTVCVSAALGLVFLMTQPGNNGEYGPIGVTLLVCGAGLMILMEVLVRREKPFFRAGLEEAVLYSALACLAAAFLILIDHGHWPSYALACLGGAICALAALRYADGLLAALALASGFYILFDVCAKPGGAAQGLLPFLVMLVSALDVWAAGAALGKPAWRYWAHLARTLRFLGFLTGYLGGNYLVVRELSRALLGLSLGSGEDLPLAPVFHALTYGLPCLYIGLGLARKDRLCLRAGLLTMAMAVFTYKYYHHVLSLEMGLILAGLALIGSAWAALRYFRRPRHGITAEPAPRPDRQGLPDAESLAILAGFGDRQSLPQDPAPPGPPDMQGGGGGFGGGGASEKF